MINETLNQTIEKATEITFENWTNISLSPHFIVVSIIVWLICMITYFIVGACVGYKGTYVKKKMIEFPNFFYAVVIWTFIYWALYLPLIMFPLWLKWIS